MTKYGLTPKGEEHAEGPGRRVRSAVSARVVRWRWVALAAAVAAPILVFATLPAGARPVATSAHTIRLVAHETHRKAFNHGGFGDEEIFSGILDNAAGATRVGIFAGTLTSVSSNDSLDLGTVDLQLRGGQITVQGFADFTRSRIVHAITGGTGIYRDAGGEFSFTSASKGVLDMTLTLVR
jgi:hypothetical protein